MKPRKCARGNYLSDQIGKTFYHKATNRGQAITTYPLKGDIIDRSIYSSFNKCIKCNLIQSKDLIRCTLCHRNLRSHARTDSYSRQVIKESKRI